MEVRRCMLAPEHLDNDTEELAYGWHERTWIRNEPIMPPVFVCLPVLIFAQLQTQTVVCVNLYKASRRPQIVY
jgi:hypothetical protein